MAVVIRTKRGKEVTLLNPSEKGNKFANELRNNCKYTNGGLFKLDKNGQYIKLNDAERAYRAGYLAAQKDSAKAFKHNKNKKSRSIVPIDY